MDKIAIIPGGFKPPTYGHFYLVQEVTNRPEIDKVIILIGPKEREGITKEQSLQIWNIYKRYLKDNVEIQLTQSPSPIQDIHGIIKNNPNDFFYPIVGTRGDDTSDIKRYDTLSKYPNQKVIIINSPTDEISGTKARREILNNNFEGFQKYIPTELSMEDRKKIWDIFVTSPSKDIFGLNEIIQNIAGETPFFLNISKFNQPKTFVDNLREALHEITLSKKNAVDINGGLMGGKFIIGNKIYVYSIKNIPNPYKDEGKFYNIQFTPEDKITSKPTKDIDSKDYIKILSTMYKIIVDFVEKEKPKYVGIASMDNTGDKNYHTIYANLTDNKYNRIPGYFRKDVNLKFDTPEGNGRFVVLKRKESNLNENISKEELKYIEKIADEWFEDYGIDVTFTKHFIERVNDERNGKPITFEELEDLFTQTAEKYGDKLANLPDDYQAVLFKLKNDLNLPFVLNYDEENDEIDLVAKTVMRKKNFMTSNPKLPLEENKSIKKQQILDNIKSLTEYMIKQGLNIKPLPKLKFIDNDEENANNFFGKTAYYNPIDNLIVLYTMGRHPKDCTRSYSHEMIHRIQNNEGRLQNITTQNTNEDDNLLELEKEAYLNGNIIFRNWTDSIINPQKLNEGRYDRITNMISSDILRKWKQGFNAGKKYSILDTFYESSNIDLTVVAKIFFIPGFKKYRVDGSMNEDGDVLLVDFKIDPSFLPEYWEEISFDLKDVVRHEIEHSTQTSHEINSRPGKFMDDDTLARQAIQAKLIPKTFYYKLKKEIDANLQGLYLKAKKSRKPFKDVIIDYLTKSELSQEQIEDILDTWRPRARALSLPQI